jgi:hypothetical protein
VADQAYGAHDDGRRTSYRASVMAHAEFEDLRGLERGKRVRLTCINPRCDGPLYLRRTDRGLQLFAHHVGTLTSCPERRGEGGESESHLRMKDHLGRVAEALGLRVEPEYRIAGLRTDLAAFVPTATSDHGPVLCIEVQNSPLAIDELDWRDSTLRAELERYTNTNPGDGPRAVPWFINHTPAWAPERAHFQVDRDDTGSVVSGLYEWGNPDGDAIALRASAVIAEIRRGRIVRLTDTVASLDGSTITRTASSYWATQPGQVPGVKVRALRPKRRTKPDAVSRPCDRDEDHPPEPVATEQGQLPQVADSHRAPILPRARGGTSTFNCPRCGHQVTEEFYGPCPDCCDQLRAEAARHRRRVVTPEELVRTRS